MLSLFLDLVKSSTSHTSNSLSSTLSTQYHALPSIAITSIYISLFIMLLPFIGLILVYTIMCIRNQVTGSSKVLNSLPRPPRYPVVGHLGKFAPKMIHEYVYEWTMKIGEGKNFGAWMLYEPVVVVNDPQDLYYILGRQQHQFTKAKVYGEMLNWSIPHNMLKTDGEEWQKQRTTFNPFFHYTEIKNTQDHVYEETQIMSEVIDEHISKNKPIDVALQFECLTLDVLGKTGFAFDFNAQRDNRFRDAMRIIMEYCASRVFDPLWRFKLSIARQAHNNEKMIKKTIKDIWEKRRKEGLDESDTDLLAQMMRAEKNGAEWITKFTNGDSWQQYSDQMTLFLFAGSDTTSSLLASTVYILARHPDKLKKLQEELDANIDPVKQPGSDECMKMVYLNACIKEALRIRPSVSMVARQILGRESITLPSGLKITPQCILMCAIRNVHLNKQVWGEDAEEFVPERWINEKGELEAKQPHANKEIPISSAYIPFAAGQRTCIGQNLARLEAAISLAVLLRRFEFSIPPRKKNEEPLFETAITMGYTNGLPMIAKRRVNRWKVDERVYYGNTKTLKDYPQAELSTPISSNAKTPKGFQEAIKTSLFSDVAKQSKQAVTESVQSVKQVASGTEQSVKHELPTTQDSKKKYEKEGGKS